MTRDDTMAISDPVQMVGRTERNNLLGKVGGDTGRTENEEDDEKPRTLFVGNVPREVHKREIEEVFGDIGPLKRCYIQYPRDGNEKKKQREDTTVAYVTFALSQDATTALETLQSTKIGGNRINIKFAKARSEQSRMPFGGERGAAARFQRSANLEPVAGAAPKIKESRPKAVKKKSRLIVRNLSFKVTDEKLKEYFEKFGEVKDVNILKKPNGKLVGCAFIQYQNIFQAANAIKELNLKPFLGRPIAIDWALPKQKYQTDEEKAQNKNAETPVDTAIADDTIEIKDEPDSEVDDNNSQFDALDPYEHLKSEPMDVDEIKEEPQNETKHVAKRKLKAEDSDDEDDEITDDSTSEAEEKHRHSTPKRTKRIGNDVDEGKTLFLRNLSFDTTEDELKKFFEKFGPLHYGLLCKDPLTEHPKGTGFVKFKDKSAADKCLQQYQEDESEFTISRRQINVSVALSKEKVENKPRHSGEDKQGGAKKTGDNKPKADSRNLYLVREGFVRPGSAAASDVSASDMHKRASLNQVKKQMLKNLNIFISPTRLCIHNLPPNFSDKQLRKLFAKYAGTGAKITEARIMRDMKDMDLNGKGKSKEFGFVNFKEHEHALTALRAINNNPEVFKPTSRPIVEFSLENRMAIRAKERRALKSKEKNPNLKQKESETKEENEAENEESGTEDNPGKERQQKQKSLKKKKGSKNLGSKDEEENKNCDGDEGEEQAAPKYAGLVAKKGVQSVPSFKPKGKITRNSLKPKKSKKMKKLQERKQREPKVPSKRPVEKVDKTEKIISKYRQKLDLAEKKSMGKRKKKWFQ